MQNLKTKQIIEEPNSEEKFYRRTWNFQVSTGHGWRAVLVSLLNKQQYNRENTKKAQSTLLVNYQGPNKLSIRSKFTRSRFRQTTNTTKRTNEPNSVNFNQCARVYFVIRNTRARHVKQPAWQAASNEVKPDITRTCYRLPLPELQLLLSINYYAFIRIFNGNIHITNCKYTDIMFNCRKSETIETYL